VPCRRLLYIAHGEEHIRDFKIARNGATSAHPLYCEGRKGWQTQSATRCGTVKYRIEASIEVHVNIKSELQRRAVEKGLGEGWRGVGATGRSRECGSSVGLMSVGCDDDIETSNYATMTTDNLSYSISPTTSPIELVQVTVQHYQW